MPKQEKDCHPDPDDSGEGSPRDHLPTSLKPFENKTLRETTRSLDCGPTRRTSAQPAPI